MRVRWIDVSNLGRSLTLLELSYLLLFVVTTIVGVQLGVRVLEASALAYAGEIPMRNLWTLMVPSVFVLPLAVTTSIITFRDPGGTRSVERTSVSVLLSFTMVTMALYTWSQLGAVASALRTDRVEELRLALTSALNYGAWGLASFSALRALRGARRWPLEGLRRAAAEATLPDVLGRLSQPRPFDNPRRWARSRHPMVGWGCLFAGVAWLVAVYVFRVEILALLEAAGLPGALSQLNPLGALGTLLVARRQFDPHTDDRRSGRRGLTLWLRTAERAGRSPHRQWRWSPGRWPGADLESRVGALMGRFGPIVAIGRPGDDMVGLGNGRTTMPVAAWRQQVQEWMASARNIVVTLGADDAARWVHQQLHRGRWLGKTVFWLPIGGPDDPSHQLAVLAKGLADTPWGPPLVSVDEPESVRSLVLHANGSLTVVMSEHGRLADYHAATLVALYALRNDPPSRLLDAAAPADGSIRTFLEALVRVAAPEAQRRHLDTHLAALHRGAVDEVRQEMCVDHVMVALEDHREDWRRALAAHALRVARLAIGTPQLAFSLGVSGGRTLVRRASSSVLATQSVALFVFLASALATAAAVYEHGSAIFDQLGLPVRGVSGQVLVSLMAVALGLAISWLISEFKRDFRRFRFEERERKSVLAALRRALWPDLPKADEAQPSPTHGMRIGRGVAAMVQLLVIVVDLATNYMGTIELWHHVPPLAEASVPPGDAMRRLGMVLAAVGALFLSYMDLIVAAGTRLGARWQQDHAEHRKNQRYRASLVAATARAMTLQLNDPAHEYWMRWGTTHTVPLAMVVEGVDAAMTDIEKRLAATPHRTSGLGFTRAARDANREYHLVDEALFSPDGIDCLLRHVLIVIIGEDLFVRPVGLLVPFDEYVGRRAHAELGWRLLIACREEIDALMDDIADRREADGQDRYRAIERQLDALASHHPAPDLVAQRIDATVAAMRPRLLEAARRRPPFDYLRRAAAQLREEANAAKWALLEVGSEIIRLPPDDYDRRAIELERALQRARTVVNAMVRLASRSDKPAAAQLREASEALAQDIEQWATDKANRDAQRDAHDKAQERAKNQARLAALDVWQRRLRSHPRQRPISLLRLLVQCGYVDYDGEIPSRMKAFSALVKLDPGQLADVNRGASRLIPLLTDEDSMRALREDADLLLAIIKRGQ